jgi:hypothetical protein
MDNLIICPRCTSDACYELKNNDIVFWDCFGCGFQSNSTLTTSNPNLDDIVSTLPELYKDLRYIDEMGKCWFPKTVNIPSKGMVFANGKSILDWKWSAVLSVPIDENEKSKFHNQNYKMDMRTIKDFDERDYIEALDYINYFDK